MNAVCRAGGIALSVLLAALSCLTGCESGGHFSLFGYTTRPTFDDTIKTVYIPMALNVTYRKDLEKILTRAVQQELTSFNSPYRLVSDPRRADTELTMKIVSVRKSTILQNQLGENRDAEIGFNVEVVWRDLRPGHAGEVLSNPKRYDPNELPLPGEVREPASKAIPILITPSATYAPELGGSRASAEDQACKLAARQIIQMMERWP